MNPDSGALRRLEAHHIGEIDHLVWSVDGKSLLFNEVHGTDTNLYRLDIAADKLEAVTSEVGTFRALAYSKDRSAIAYSFNDFDTPTDLYASALDGSGAIRLTHANPWIEEEILLPKSRVLQWQSSDGTIIEGIFMLPSDYREGAKVPLVLQIHGGPSGYWANAFEPDLIVLAGFMRVLGPPLLERFQGRIINVHPALLPSFAGHSGPQDALDGGVRISGCTVHIVDAGVDTGPIIAQAAVPVLPDDTADTLHARIQVQEHRLLPRVIHQIAIGAITLDPLSMSTPVVDPAQSLTVPDA